MVEITEGWDEGKREEGWEGVKGLVRVMTYHPGQMNEQIPPGLLDG